MNILDDTNPEMPTKYTTDQLKHSVTSHCIDLDIKAQSIDTDVVDDCRNVGLLYMYTLSTKALNK